MSYRLPPVNSPLRDLFSMSDLVAMLAPAKASNLTTFASALRAAPDTIKRLGAASINQVVVKANGSICLYHFGPRGGRKLLWQFSK